MNQTFENAVVKVQSGLEDTLTRPEKAQLKRFLLDRTDEEEEKEDDGVDSLARRHQAHQEQKRLRTTKPTKYRCLKHIYSTTNCVESLFSRAKINMSDLRKSMAPHRLEALMFLRFNRFLWNASTIEDAIRARLA